jgi:eukaryotic-like serine/threonine-protein kinase
LFMKEMEMKRRFLVITLLLLISMSMISCQFVARTKVTESPQAKTENPVETTRSPEAKTQASTDAPVLTETKTDMPSETQTSELKIGSTQVSPKDGMTMVYVTAGKFLMGSLNGVGNPNEHPQHTLNLDAFWIDQTEVTNAMFALFVSDTDYKTTAEIAGKSYTFTDDKKWQRVDGADWTHPNGSSSDITRLDDYPVVHVSWADALAYCEWAGRSLPTEAQWEKAARWKQGEIYPWGDKAPTGTLANFADKSSHFTTSDPSINDGYEFSAPVGSYPKGESDYGALDMAGNVWEWVSSLSSDYPYNAKDGRENLTIVGTRVLRGGSWFDAPVSLRSADRYAFDQTYTGLNTGFRCALPNN